MFVHYLMTIFITIYISNVRGSSTHQSPSFQRVKKLIDTVSNDKILLIQGKLHPDEEADLIQEAMRKIRSSGKFKGIELATFTPRTRHLGMFQNFREKLAVTFFGDRDVLTVIGPAARNTA